MLVRWVPVAPIPHAGLCHLSQRRAGRVVFNAEVGQHHAKQVGNVILTVYSPRVQGPSHNRLATWRSAQPRITASQASCKRLQPKHERLVRVVDAHETVLLGRGLVPRTKAYAAFTVNDARQIGSLIGRQLPHRRRPAGQLSRGKFNGHRGVPSRGVAPPVVAAMRGLRMLIVSAVAAHDLALGRRSQWTVGGC